MAQRDAFLKWQRRQDPNRLVFLDEAGANLAMGWSHVWGPRGEEYVEPRPMNWGDNLTLVGAIRRSGWLVLSTKWRAMNKIAFITWVRRRLAPRLRRGDIVVLDNLPAHKAAEVRVLMEEPGARVKRLPPYSHDFNPIEPVWRLVKKRIRDYAPPTDAALRRVARAARHAATPYHRGQYFSHAGCGHSTENRNSNSGSSLRRQRRSALGALRWRMRSLPWGCAPRASTRHAGHLPLCVAAGHGGYELPVCLWIQCRGSRHSVVVIPNYREPVPRSMVKARAVLFVLARLGRPWRAAAVFGLLPTTLLNWIYDSVARHRQRVFVRSDRCLVPRPEYRRRFPDAGSDTGASAEVGQ